MVLLQFSLDFLDQITLFADSNLNQIVIAALVMIFGLIIAKVASTILRKITKDFFGKQQQKPLKALARLIELIIFYYFFDCCPKRFKGQFCR